MKNIIKKIESKTGYKNIVETISSKISGSEFNSLLLGLFQKRTDDLTPSKVLHEFKKNRFCLPSSVSPIVYKKEEIEWLEYAETNGFVPVELSPLAPLGTCSTVAEVDQNNIVSAARGTEVISDVTNVLALKAADEIKIKGNEELIKYCTTHRQVRGQYFTNPAFTAHFNLFGMITAGKDTGNYDFEIEQLENHIGFYYNLLKNKFDGKFFLKIFANEDDNPEFYSRLNDLLTKVEQELKIDIVRATLDNNYYQNVQFKFFVRHNQIELDVADGGFVNWTQKLLSNKKQRLLISAAGLELIIKLENDLL